MHSEKTVQCLLLCTPLPKNFTSSLHNSVAMINEMNKKQLTEKILNHALGIIYLLTGEEYVVMKKNSPHSTTDQLTGEVPIKCGDISISFSMEEWDYIEEHKDLYKDVMVKNHQSISAVTVRSNLSSDLQEDNVECVSIKDGAEDAGNKEDDESPVYSTESLTGEVNGNTQNVEPVEKTPKESEEEEEIIDVTDHSVVRGTFEESHQEVCPEGEALHTTYVPQELQREGFTNNFSNDYDVVNLISDSVSEKHKPFSLSENFHPENSASWENVHIVRRKSRKQDLHSKIDYLGYEPLNEDHPVGFDNGFPCVTLHQESSTPFICGECGRCFISELSFTEHMKEHSKEKPHRCYECGREFEYRSRLIVHQRTHNGEKPHKCELCGKDFNYRSRLLVHQRKHTGVKPHKCNQCGKQFDYKSHLLRHQRTHT